MMQLQFDAFEPTPQKKTIQESFEAFHNANPWILRELLKMTDDLIDKGQKNVGINMLFEVLRWSHIQTVRDESKFKLNNNYAPRYVRLIEQVRPDLIGVFNKRTLQTQ